jgi:hypothetical protein
MARGDVQCGCSLLSCTSMIDGGGMNNLERKKMPTVFLPFVVEVLRGFFKASEKRDPRPAIPASIEALNT